MAKDNTQEQFARLVGITQPRVSQLIQKGILTRGAPIGQWLREFVKNLEEQAAGRQSLNGDFDLVQQRARHSARQAEALELELAKKRGELVPLSVLVDALNFCNATIRSKVLAVPSRYRSLSSGTTPKQIDILDNLVREILTELSNVKFPGDIAEQAQRYVENLHASAKAKGQRVGGQVSNAQPGV